MADPLKPKRGQPAKPQEEKKARMQITLDPDLRDYVSEVADRWGKSTYINQLIREDKNRRGN